MLTRETSAGYLTNWGARLFARELDRQLAPSGISPAYMPIMFALADGGALTQKALARRAAVEQPTMAMTLNRMERDAMISRRPDPEDKRSALVSLTDKALGLVATVEGVITRINGIAMEGLAPDEQAQFLRLMLAIIGALEAQDRQF